MWADHLTIARCCACMAEQDLSAAISTMGAGLHLLQRDLILESVLVELVQEIVQSAWPSALLHLVLHYLGWSTQWKPSGAKEIRTPDPLHAMQVLYQLSYGPKYLIWQWLQSISSNITIILHHSSIPNLRQILLNYALLIFYGGVFIIYFITKTSQSSFWKNFANLPINFKGSFCFSWFQGLRH